jgi:hypothetical protein
MVRGLLVAAALLVGSTPAGAVLPPPQDGGWEAWVAESPSAAGSLSAKVYTVQGPDLRARLDVAMEHAQQSEARASLWVAYTVAQRSGTGLVDPAREETPDGEVLSRPLSQRLVPVEHKKPVLLLRFGPEARHPEEVRLSAMDDLSVGAVRVYWLGRSENAESLAFLRWLLRRSQSAEVAERLTLAIGLHDGPEAASVLSGVALSSPFPAARAIAAAALAYPSRPAGMEVDARRERAGGPALAWPRSAKDRH